MADELVDVIDENNKVIRQKLKSVVHEKGLRHRVSALLVRDNKDRYLIPTASEIKVEAGKLFHSAAGHVSSGESYETSAARELWEECGLKVLQSELKILGSFWMEKDYPTRKEKELFKVFEVLYSPEMGMIELNEEQVEEKWLTINELLEIYKKDKERFSFPLLISMRKLFNFK